MMQRRKPWLGVLLLVFVVMLAACGGSSPAAPAPASTTAPAEVAAEPTEVAAEEPTVAPTAPVEENATSSEMRSFVIDPAQSIVRFTLTEELMGAPTTVVGESNAIEGGVDVDLADYANTSITALRVDAGAFVTDNDFRNRAIRRFILQSEQPQYQYITFAPTVVEGLPENATVGEAFEFTVSGDMTIRDVTQPVAFTVSLTPVSETQLEGSARTTVLRSDFDLQIPDVPSVANVSEDVLLEIEFVAVAQ